MPFSASELPSHISLKSVREYWLDGLNVLCSPPFDARCHRCGQLLWGRVVSPDDSAVRTTNLFGVPPTDVITSAIFEFRNDLFANYVQQGRAEGEKQARIILGGTMKDFVAKPRATVIKKESMLTMHATPSKRGIAYLLV